MHSSIITRTVVTASMLVASGGTFAALIGLPLLDFPATVSNQTGTVDYNTATELFSIASAPAFVKFSAPAPPQLVTAVAGTPVLTVDILVGANGMITGGHPGEDLYVFGEVTDPTTNITYSGVLLTGEIADFGYLDLSEGTTDQYDMRFTLTGGALAPLFNGSDIGVNITSENSTFAGSFSLNFGGSCKATLGPIPAYGPLRGCTPGYWKQQQHFGQWPAAYTTNTRFEFVFGRDVLGAADPTLLEALRLNGGGVNALIRHSAAALLNAAHPGVNSNIAFNTPTEVIAAFQAAFDNGDYEPLKNLLESSNENGCPLN